MRPPDALRRRTHLSGGQFTPPPTRHDRTVLSCLAGGANWPLSPRGGCSGVRKCPTTSLPLGRRGCCIFGGDARSSIGDGLCWISMPEFCSRLRRGGPKSRLRGESRGRNTGLSRFRSRCLKVTPPSTSLVVGVYRRGLCDTQSCEPTSRRIADFSAASNPGFDLPIEHGCATDFLVRLLYKYSY